MFERLVWKADRMLLDELVFRLEHYRSDEWELGEECFVFIKIKPLIDQYAKLWQSLGEFHPSNILELGIWDGGSVAFWCEYFKDHMRRYVAVDKATHGDSKYFSHYLASRNLEDRVRTYWGVDQADSAHLWEVVRDSFDGPLDLIIDDASHMYRATRKSFEALFPLLRSGGLYLIEDWAWAHWKEFQPADHPWGPEIPLTRLIVELVEATGTSTELIAGLRIHEGFAVVERGPMKIPDPTKFTLDRHILRRQEVSPLERILGRLRNKVKDGVSRVRGKPKGPRR